MGKTTLWLAGLEHAAERRIRVLAARPTDAEATFAYAALIDLLEHDWDAARASLSGPQERALRVALLRQDAGATAADQGVVAIAFLNALRALARQGPILVAVDDVQWLDRPTAIVLGFAIRRFRDERIGILLARRVETGERTHVDLDRPLSEKPPERVLLPPLGAGAIGTILGMRLRTACSRRAIARLHAASGGNPLFAIELGRTLASQRSLEGELDPSVPEELASLVGEPLASLPLATRDVLAVAASLAQPTLQLVSLVVDGPVGPVLDPAIEAHVIEIDGGRI
jgi:predicted ATPase